MAYIAIVQTARIYREVSHNRTLWIRKLQSMVFRELTTPFHILFDLENMTTGDIEVAAMRPLRFPKALMSIETLVLGQVAETEDLELVTGVFPTSVESHGDSSNDWLANSPAAARGEVPSHRIPVSPPFR